MGLSEDFAVSNLNQAPFLSIVIPAYNEEHRLPPSLEKIVTYLREQQYASEILVVENGSSDATTAVVQAFIDRQLAADGKVRLLLLHSEPGKGAAVKSGMLAAQGEYRFICDADLAMPIEEIAKFLPPTQPGGSFDIAIASRELPGAVRYGEPVYRHIMGRVFNWLVRLLAVPGIQDTQCGFKMFTKEAAQTLFPLQRIDGWGFDVEVLYIARRRGMRLTEAPINWYYQRDSRVRPFHDTVNMVRELLKIRRNGNHGFYDLPSPLPTADELPAV